MTVCAVESLFTTVTFCPGVTGDSELYLKFEMVIVSALAELPPAADDPAPLGVLLDTEGMDIEGDIDDIEPPEPLVAALAAEVLPGDAFVADDPHPVRESAAARATAGSATAGRRVRRIRAGLIMHRVRAVATGGSVPASG